MKPLSIVETKPGFFSLLLHCGTTKVDELVEELGHEANGYFWEGVAQVLVKSEAASLEGKFDYDPEGSMFAAYGTDRGALEQLGALMAEVANDPDRLRKLMATAEGMDFEFDD